MNKILLRNKINRFYATLATVDAAYNNCVVTKDDLTNTAVLEEVLYDIEDNFFTYEGSRKLHNQVMKHIRGIEKHRQTLIAMIVAGLLLVVGAAGSSDLNVIPFAQAIVLGIVGLTCMSVGTILYTKGEN